MADREWIDRRYRILGQLGAGAAGAVMLAEDTRLERRVALKLLRGHGPLADPERFRSEARLLVALRHPGVVELLDFGVWEGGLYLVLEVLPGGSLRRHLAKNGPLRLPACVDLAHGLLEALRYAHARGVIHRDVKPENVLLAGDGSARLADFGLARLLGDSGATRAGLILGTPATMAPEVLRGEDASPASDLFSWGALVLEAATGVPLRGGDPVAMVRRPGVPVGRLEAAPEELQPALAAALREDPRERADAAMLARWLPAAGMSERRARPRFASRPTRRLASPPRSAPEPGPAPARTRSREAPEGRGAGPRPVPAGLARWVGLGALLALPMLSLSAPPPVPPPMPGRPVAVPPALARLERLVTGLDVEAWITSTQARLEPLASPLYTYTQWMGRVRAGEDPGGVQARVRKAAAGLRPFRPGAGDLGQLQRIAAGSLGPEMTMRLVRALEPLQHLEAYQRAWGLATPGTARRLLATAWGLGLEDWPETSEDPGAAVLFRWSQPVDRQAPYLLPEEYPLGWMEDALYEGKEVASRGAWRREGHGAVRVPLPAGAPGSWISLRVANLLAPNVLRVRVGELELVVHGDPDTDPSGNWNLSPPRWRRLRFRVPPWIDSGARGALVVKVTPLPGLPRWGGAWLDRIEWRRGPVPS